MIGLDTSFLLAAEGRHGVAKWRVAGAVLRNVAADELIVPAQAMAEMLQALQRAYGTAPEEAGAIAARWLRATRSAGITSDVAGAARALGERSALALEDALMIVAAHDAGARLLLTEDIAPGLAYGALTIVNPFDGARGGPLERLLGAGWSEPAAERSFSR